MTTTDFNSITSDQWKLLYKHFSLLGSIVINLVSIVKLSPYLLSTEFFRSGCKSIGTCRVVWVPRQDLAMPHFDAQLRKAYFVTALYAVYTSVNAYAICW